MADAAAAEEPAVKLEFQNFGSSGEGVVDGRIGRGAAPPGMCTERPRPRARRQAEPASVLRGRRQCCAHARAACPPQRPQDAQRPPCLCVRVRR